MIEEGRVVYGPIRGVSIGADATIDIWNVLATSAVNLRLLGFELTADDIAAELTTASLHFISTAGSGGSAVTEQHADDRKTTAILASMVTGATTPGTDAGYIMGFQWEKLGALGHIFTPEMAPICKASEGFALTQDSAVAMTVSGYACWQEIYV